MATTPFSFRFLCNKELNFTHCITHSLVNASLLKM